MTLSSQWQPSASIKNLLARSKIISEIRHFFTDRGLLEVETPILSEFGVTDIHLSTFNTTFKSPSSNNSKILWLSTSPEYHMKRLLASGSGAIFQITKVFRNEEVGKKHNPEFTMLEWYRPFFDMHRLINEVDDLLQNILDCEPAEILTYQFVFQEYVGLDPLSAKTSELIEKAKKCNLINAEEENRDTLIQFLFSELVEPQIGKTKPVAVYHFPASQAALAQISSEDLRVAERFEFYYKGIELANGFCELTDPDEQQKRFEQDNKLREIMNLPQQEIDHRFISALKSGMPNCSGVALGIDRLIMIALGSETIEEVIAFNINNA
ncbi:lysyl-tRNA synthetase class 2 [Bisgaardia hudsonensis]|uniref:Elongation factor P--(R)-beta-lysine ligase n=1 Tax=Bisgaardia hudsonensis TaxID=109472 RepID=A0A4R2N317_9PAST|nr:elongation factor P--(R)-beta-lysine ligase [Bisgaardia hudsonensis]QLB12753.1 elongation factor P lysine(34) lysyltransferase [Bisgaardia hudsonensis]TCP14303.1 lysyl-tRNA synthetase class 2 [Bisgaardia hudsonensis]